MNLEIKIKKQLGDFALDVELSSDSRRIGILGASGGGKSMTLKCIAGIETPDEGYIKVGEHVLYDSAKKVNLKPQIRNVGYLFQNYALFPTMTVAKNIAAGLKGTKEDKQVIVERMVKKFQLEGLEERLPGELSGGQQQRVALARIMAYEPDVILLDEPFSALDVYLKDRLQQELIGMLSDYQGIVIMVSHSRDEIYRFSDTLLVLDEGKNVIAGPTKAIFANPKKKAAAKLTGCKNFADVKVLDPHHMEILDWGITYECEGEIPEGTDCIGYRAHHFKPCWGEKPKNALKVEIASIAELPFETNYYLRPQGNRKNQAADICWFVQKNQQLRIEDRGIPGYLEIPESGMMYLQK